MTQEIYDLSIVLADSCDKSKAPIFLLLQSLFMRHDRHFSYKFRMLHALIDKKKLHADSPSCTHCISESAVHLRSIAEQSCGPPLAPKHGAELFRRTMPHRSPIPHCAQAGGPLFGDRCLRCGSWAKSHSRGVPVPTGPRSGGRP